MVQLLLDEALANDLAAKSPRASIPTTNGQRMSSSIDPNCVLLASQAISGEIVLGRLLLKLMEIVLPNAGAQRGILILEDQGELVVHVEALLSSSPPPALEPLVMSTALTPTHVARYAGIAKEVVRSVGRTRERVILSDAAREGAFTEDAYVTASRLRSILCTPLVHQDQLLGMLYLENNLTTGAFTPERLEVLRLLSSPIAASIWNARRYDEMERKLEAQTNELERRNVDLQAAVLDLKTTQARLVASEKMASLGQLTAGIAHEIKNPLNFVNNFAELNAELAAELVEELEQHPDTRLADVKDTFLYLKLNAEKICEHGVRADSIVRSMMRHASGGEGARRKVDVNAFVEEYVSLAFHGVRAHQRSLQVTIERDYDPSAGTAEMLPEEMGRVFVNLFNNAFYAVRDKQLKADGPYTPSVTVSTQRQGNHVRIFVQDNGPGIPRAVRDQIFVPFFTTKPPGSGTGLGLSMSYDIVVHGHRGMLAVESAEGEGATFIVTLPV